MELISLGRRGAKIKAVEKWWNRLPAFLILHRRDAYATIINMLKVRQLLHYLVPRLSLGGEIAAKHEKSTGEGACAPLKTV
jgi:hypothetical protein